MRNMKGTEKRNELQSHFPYMGLKLNELTVQEIISAMDKNLNAKSRVVTSKMIVHGRRSSRTIESKNWVVGINQAFTEYLSPPREAGTKC